MASTISAAASRSGSGSVIGRSGPSSLSPSPNTSPAQAKRVMLPEIQRQASPDTDLTQKGRVAHVRSLSDKPPPFETLADKSPSPTIRPTGHCSKGSRVGVLSVEDVRVAQRLVRTILSLAHYRVEEAGSGEEALDKFRALMSRLQLVLMDVGLPAMDGVETARRIRAIEAEAAAQAEVAGETPAAPVFIYALTATVDPADLARYQRAGMNGCILKGKVLADCVRQAVEESKRNPHAFVNMAAKFHDAPSPSSSGSGASPSSGASGVREP